MSAGSGFCSPAALRGFGRHDILREGTAPNRTGLTTRGVEDVSNLEPRRNNMPNQGGTHEQHVKAGQQSHKNDDSNRQQQASENKSGHRGGSGNFAEDREKASEAGRKGGQH